MDWTACFPSGTHVIALPDWQRPRLYLPASQTWFGSAFYPAFRPQARLYRLFLRFKAYLGLNERREICSSGWPLGEFIQDVLPQAVIAVVQVGTPGPTQKLIVRLHDEQYTTIGYLKYATTTAARRRMRQEHTILSRLPKGLGPDPLKYGEWMGGDALLVTPLEGLSGAAVLPLPEGVLDFLDALRISKPVPLEQHPWVRALEPGLEPWLEELARQEWPIVLGHGDLCPWHLRRKPDGNLGAIDWEFGSHAGFPYLDLVFAILQTAILIYHWSPRRSLDYAVDYLTRLVPGLTTREARALCVLGAYDAYRSSLADGHRSDEPLQAWRLRIMEEAK